MAEFVYGLFIVMIVTLLLSSLMLKRSEKDPERVIHLRSGFSNILGFFRSHISGPEYTRQD
jgi:hypothetical protein